LAIFVFTEVYRQYSNPSVVSGLTLRTFSNRIGVYLVVINCSKTNNLESSAGMFDYLNKL